MDWGKTDLTSRPVIGRLFAVPALQGIHKGTVKTVFVLLTATSPRSPRELANIERTIYQCCGPMSLDPGSKM